MSEELEQEEQIAESQDEVPAEIATEEAVIEETVVEETIVVEAVEEEIIEEEELVHKLSKPSVIDFKAILQPISAEKPSGEYMRYSGIYDEIGEARRTEEALGKEDFGIDLKIADFAKVIELAVPVLEKESKDLQISAWLGEALVNRHGYAGLRDSLKLTRSLLDKFWETLYPEIDEGDMEGRANAIAWMDKEAALAITKAPITDGEGYGYLDLQDSIKYTIPDNLDMLEYEEQNKYKALAAEAEKLNRVTAEKWNRAVGATKRAFCEELNVAIGECKDELKKLNLAIEENFDIQQAPSLPNLQKTLDNILIETGKILKLKREEEPDEFDEEIAEGEAGEAGSVEGGGGKGSISSTAGAIQNRKEALRRLTELAEFFRKTEPHSPVSYLVTRAVKWGNMPLESWLQDVIKDETIIYQLRQTLGFNTGTESAEATNDASGYDSQDQGYGSYNDNQNEYQ